MVIRVSCDLRRSWPLVVEDRCFESRFGHGNLSLVITTERARNHSLFCSSPALNFVRKRLFYILQHRALNFRPSSGPAWPATQEMS